MHNLDLSGLNCPMPVLKTKKFLSQLESGELVKIITSDPAAIHDLQEFCHKTGNILINQEQQTNKTITIIQRR